MTNGPSLNGLRVAVDVQHLYRPPPRDLDRGASFVLASSGTRVSEADLVLLYAQSLTAALRARGAQVLENEPLAARMVGHYGSRNRTAAVWGAHAYLACHLNAGGGNYATFKHMTMNPGVVLAEAIAIRVAQAFGVIRKAKVEKLHTGERGAVCIEECPPRVAAVLLEPCFGDNPSHQELLVAPRLAQLGETIAFGVADWWIAAQLTTGPAGPPA